MRILIDTNVLVSALIFPNGVPSRALFHVCDNHELVLSDQNIMELRDIVSRKWPDRMPDAEVFIAELAFELVPAIHSAEKLIRDAKDQPILNAAIIANVDIIVTGDKDFLSLTLESPACMSPSQYLSECDGVDSPE